MEKGYMRTHSQAAYWHATRVAERIEDPDDISHFLYICERPGKRQ